MRTKQTMPDISIATVYNCLVALVKCNLVRQVNLDRGATRYCPNMKDHFHFYCDECGRMFDIDSGKFVQSAHIKLPKGFTMKHCEISLRGICPECDVNQ